ncbi:hypothetical protein, partial [Pseudoneobacillus sp. C159]
KELIKAQKVNLACFLFKKRSLLMFGCLVFKEQLLHINNILICCQHVFIYFAKTKFWWSQGGSNP